MHLSDWIKEKKKEQPGYSQEKFGEEMDPPVSQGLVGQWCRGETQITLPYALQIEKRTGGKVTPQDCADMYKGSKLRTPKEQSAPEAEISPSTSDSPE